MLVRIELQPLRAGRRALMRLQRRGTPPSTFDGDRWRGTRFTSMLTLRAASPAYEESVLGRS